MGTRARAVFSKLTGKQAPQSYCSERKRQQNTPQTPGFRVYTPQIAPWVYTLNSTQCQLKIPALFLSICTSKTVMEQFEQSLSPPPSCPCTPPPLLQPGRLALSSLSSAARIKCSFHLWNQTGCLPEPMVGVMNFESSNRNIPGGSRPLLVLWGSG